MRPLALRSVLAAADMREPSSAVVATAEELARLTGSRLVILHVMAEPDPSEERKAVEQLRAWSGPGFKAADCRVIVGDEADSIVEQAEEAQADVIVLGPHRQGRGSAELGSTADQVVRRARIPCLVVPTRLPLPLGRILIPIDLSSTARGALLVGFSWASALRRPKRPEPTEPTEVTILHVSPFDRDPKDAQQALHGQIESIQSRIANAPGVQVREMVEPANDPAQVILKHLAADAVDLGVLNTRGDDSPEGLLGSVSSAVVRQSTGPVLLVPPEVWRRHAAPA
jgi:nucleotide-binding universal stress UspA family protein